MCGIAGILNFNGARTVDGGLLTAMRDSMVHRGPDGEGLWISPDGRVGRAHARLAIAGLSHAASQPRSDAEAMPGGRSEVTHRCQPSTAPMRMGCALRWNFH